MEARTEVAGTFSDEGAGRLQSTYFRVWPVLKSNAELRAAISVRQMGFAARVFCLRRMMASTVELHRLVVARDH